MDDVVKMFSDSDEQVRRERVSIPSVCLLDQDDMATTLVSLGSTNNSNATNNNSVVDGMSLFYFSYPGNGSDSPKPGRKRIEKPDLMSDKTKNRRFKELDAKISDAGIVSYRFVSFRFFFFFLLPFLDLIQLVANQPILDEWHERRTPLRQQTFMQIGINMTEAKKHLPATSTVNSTILKFGSIGTPYIFRYNFFPYT
jgi:hypothetical protein